MTKPIPRRALHPVVCARPGSRARSKLCKEGRASLPARQGLQRPGFHRASACGGNYQIRQTVRLNMD
jgi:hypothetical protein